MIDTLIKELDTETTEAETNKKLNQEDCVHAACQISNVLQVHFLLSSHAGHEGNAGSQEGGSTSPSYEGAVGHRCWSASR